MDNVDRTEVLDFVGVGFGPANLAVAVAARERGGLRGLCFESKESFQWHPGMLLDAATMQISFLKDLATLRNPASPYTFLQYLKARGRLEHFVNLAEFHPARVEYQDYLSWVADAFSDEVRYSARVHTVCPVALGHSDQPNAFRVEARDQRTGDIITKLARNVVYAPGGAPRVPDGTPRTSDVVVHSSQFLSRFPGQFQDHSRPYRFAVVGDGQSAVEVADSLLDTYPRAQVNLFISRYALRPADSSPFVNETFFSEQAESFFSGPEPVRTQLLAELRNTNYGVVDPSLLDSLYRRMYLDEVKGTARLTIRRLSRVVAVTDVGGGVELTVRDVTNGATGTYEGDGVVLATGYTRTFDEGMFSAFMPMAKRKRSGELALSEACKVETTAPLDCGVYTQGLSESSHGIGDTLLSMLPFRSQAIVDDITKSAAATRAKQPPVACSHARTKAAAMGVEYPPRRHVEIDADKLFAVIERYRFATLVSVGADGEPVVTHVPLALDRSRGSAGVLFGHMDRANPHLAVLGDQRVLATFHGPNAYISPDVYGTDQLPTWNSISVHVRGSVRFVDDRETCVRGLQAICTQSEARSYRLAADDERIDQLFQFIRGFEIDIEEMTGRFKLSQDRATNDRVRAAEELIRQTEEGSRALIESVL